MTDFKKLSAPLTVKEIEFRIQSINKGGYATILAYKNARVDINRLNESCGHLGWERKHNNGNHNCVVSLWDESNKHWVSKEDTGTESNTEAAKGLASDSFKRACFNWGIGIELYDYPVISIKLNKDEVDMTGQRPKQDYIDALEPESKPVYTQSMADVGTLPCVGMECLIPHPASEYISAIVIHIDHELVWVKASDGTVNRIEMLYNIKPITPPIKLVDGKAYQFDYGEHKETVLGFYEMHSEDFNVAGTMYNAKLAINIQLLEVKS